MDSQRPKPNSKLQGNKGKISLEEYLDFIESRHQSDLSVNYLKQATVLQIIGMHGFTKLSQAPKKVMIDTLNTIDPMNPPRSTLKDNISSCAFITLEEAVADLADLNWQECCITSIQTLNSCKENFSTQELALQDAEHPRLKSKSRAIVVANTYSFDGTSTSTCSSATSGSATKVVAKRKRRVTKAGALGGGGAVAQSGGITERWGKKTGKKEKSVKDPNKPKRPASAFMVFLEEFRKQFKEKNPNNKSIIVVSKASGDKWKSMSEAEKAPYVAKTEKSMTEYTKNMQTYNKKMAEGANAAEEDKSDISRSEVNN